MGSNSSRYLIDTHILLWSLGEEDKLGISLIKVLKNPTN